ncbi:MAG: YvcK family protein [Chloroflexi bacterium]|nr:YvcK family protein [Chloroflexota bacterium]
MSRTGLTKWLYFGLHIKRWLALLVVSVAIMGLGLAYLLREVYVTYTFPEWAYWATLQFIPRWARGLLFISGASTLAVFAGWRLNRSLAEAVAPQVRGGDLIDLVYARRTQERGPRIVAIGGGTGLSNLLRGIKRYSSNLTAIVTVADDGGSSGRLRRDLQVIPPGDIRNCIAALADAEPLVTELFQYRFREGDGPAEGVGGHAFGNLFIAAMAGVTGSMEDAIAETSRVLAVRGRIVPSTLEDIVLGARMRDGSTVRGESRIPASGLPPEEVFIEPHDAPAHPAAVRALLEADLIVIGPGSLYTSVLPNLLVPGLGRALKESRAYTILVTNVATQRGETNGFSAADHYTAVRRHLGAERLVDAVLANSNLPATPFPPLWGAEPVHAHGDDDYAGARLVLADLVDEQRRLRHDAEKLASAVMRLYFERDLRIRAEALVP